MAEPLSAADRASLAAERGPVNMAVGAALLFDDGPGVEPGAVLERLDGRLHLVPRYRQRLEETPLGLAHPVWADDPHFDLGWHLRAGALPPPAGDADLCDLVGRRFSNRLDRARPLWELDVVGGLEGDRTALIPKMHHALVDGVAAIDVGTLLLDPTPEPIDVPAPDGAWEPAPYDRGRHLARLAATPFVRAQGLMLEAARRAVDVSPRRTAEDLRRATDLVTQLARTRPQAPMTPLNHPISPNRRFAVARGELAAVKAVARATDATVNDVLLGAVAGMLRRYLAGADVDGEPVALVPVSVRRPEEEGELGNRISTVFVDLPTGEAHPLERVRAVRAQTRELKDSAAVRAGAMLVGATGWAPPAISSLMVRAMGGVRACNLIVSNVPGPQQPFYLGGCRLREIFPVVPLNPPNQGLSVGILSYDGGVFFGLLADRALDPPVDHAAAMLESALAELVEVSSP
jgi:WS/DGAT/MGAT family acyltransferase